MKAVNIPDENCPLLGAKECKFYTRELYFLRIGKCGGYSCRVFAWGTGPGEKVHEKKLAIKLIPANAIILKLVILSVLPSFFRGCFDQKWKALITRSMHFQMFTPTIPDLFAMFAEF